MQEIAPFITPVLILLALAVAFWLIVSSTLSGAGAAVDMLTEEEEDAAPARQQMLVKTYGVGRAKAEAQFRTDAIEMAAQGYFPTTQTWTPGRWGTGDFLGALFLCLILIGFIVFVYMLLVKPNTDYLTVTYELRATPVAEKPCPKCAERVKAAAVVCRFCGHEFTPAHDDDRAA